MSGHSSEAREEFDVREAFEVQVAYDQIDAELKRSGWADLPPPDSNATREEFLRQIMIGKFNSVAGAAGFTNVFYSEKYLV